MVSTLRMIEAVSELVTEAVPELESVYMDLVPQGFRRPCMLIETGEGEVTDAAKALVRVTQELTLTLYDVSDEYGRVSTARQLLLRQKVLDLFRCGYLKADDRALAVQARAAGRDWDKAYVSLKFEFLDDREEAPVDEVMIGTVDTSVAVRRQQ